MKHFLTILSAILLLGACTKIGEGDSQLNGMRFLRDEGTVIEQYEFRRSGNVIHYCRIGADFPFNTSGCDMYYTLDGEKLTIYRGIRGWERELRNTVYSSGSYHGDYIIINGNKLYRQ